MESRHSLKLWTVQILLLACMGTTAGFAATLFAGIDDLQPLPIQGNTQTIRVVSDLPFQYQLIPLNNDQVLVRFLNARLSSRLQTADGVLPVETGGSIVAHATVRISETPDVEEVVLIGEGLGRKKIILEGGEEMPVSARELSQYAVSNQNIRITQNKQTYIPGTFPSNVDNHSPYAVVQSGNGIQLPFLNPRKQGNAVETQQEQLPQSPPVRLPRPSFQPQVEGQAFNDNVSQNWRQPQDNPAPLTDAEEPVLETAPPESSSVESTESEVELQHSLQSGAPAIASNQFDNALLRPKTEIEAKPRLELALDGNTGTRRSTTSQALIKEAPFTQRPLTVDKPAVQFPEETPVSIPRPSNTPQETVAVDQSPLANNRYVPQVPVTEPAYNTLAYSSPLQLQNALDKAKSQYSEHRYEAAENTIETALQMHPKDASLYAALGELYIEQRRYPNAQMAYGQAYLLSPNAHAVRYAQVLILTHQSQQAISALQKYLSPKNIRPNPSEAAKAHYMLGTLFEERGDTAKALSHLQQAAQLLPDDADIHYNLALAYELSGNLSMAKAHYSKATQLNPTAQDAQQGLARVKKASH